MDLNNKKFLKKTNMNQFQKLVELMEEYPQLSTSNPTFEFSRIEVEEMWENVAKKVNVFGPPVRSGLEWKRVWQDQKCRVKKKIIENNKSLNGTNGGPCTVNSLTQLEQHIDRICHLSTTNKTVDITPTTCPVQIEVVIPTSSTEQLDVDKKKQFPKKTNTNQFQKLVEQMEEYPQLATSNPTFESSRIEVEEMWDNVAKKVNVFGPPVRSGLEWKRVWQDQKCRLKKKICENNKTLHGTDGGPCTINSLTQLELHIDRICHLSSAVQIAVVTPTSSTKQLDDDKKIQVEDSSDSSFSHHTVTSTPEKLKRRLQHNRKRKSIENALNRLKLLRHQNDIQNKTLDIMKKHAEAAKIQAEAVRNQAEVANDQAKALKEIADSTKVIGQALIDIIKHIKDK